MEAWEAVAGLAQGFRLTFIHLFRKPITEEYPEYKRPLPERSRARIILTRDPDGEERCVACYLCSAACPVSCISMESAERATAAAGPPGFASISPAAFTAACARRPAPPWPSS